MSTRHSCTCCTRLATIHTLLTAKHVDDLTDPLLDRIRDLATNNTATPAGTAVPASPAGTDF